MKRTTIPEDNHMTESFEKKPWRRDAFFLAVLIALGLTVFFFRLGARPLWDIDEGMHAATSRDMVRSGDWITPTLNGKNFYDKPILYNWFAALSFLAFGFTEFAARLPAAILGLGTVILTYFLGRRMFGPTAGFLSGLILATSALFIVLSRVVIHDIALTFFVTLALLSFYLSFESQEHRRRYLLLFYASLGFAVLAKGPVGLLLPGLTVGLFLVLERRIGFLREMHIGWGIVVFLAIASPWYVIMSLRHKDYGSYFFVRQNLMYFLSSDPRHPRPLYFYVPVLFGGFLPWSCFLPVAIVRLFRGFLDRSGKQMVFLLVWFSSVFLFFTAASSKLPTYLLPLFPSVSLIVGWLWYDLSKTPREDLWRWVSLSFLPLLVAPPIMLLYLLVSPPTRLAFESGVDLTRLHSLILFLTGGVGLAFWLLLTRRYRGLFSTIVGLVVVVVLVATAAILPSVDPYYSTKGLAQKLDSMLSPGEKLVFYHRLKDSALFYTNRLAVVLRGRQQLVDYLASPKTVFCIIERRHLEKLEKEKKMVYVLDREGNKFIISNKNPFSR